MVTGNMESVSNLHDRKQRAFGLIRENRHAEALQLFRELLAEAPQDPQLLQNMAVLSVRTGDFREAERHARSLIDLYPGQPEGYVRLTDALAAQGRLDQAVESLRNALALRPRAASLWVWLGNLLRDRGDAKEEVRGCFERAVEVDSGNVEACHDLGAYLQAQGELKEAIDCYRRALELRPESAYLLNSLGFGLHADARHAEAIDCYRRALEIQPGSSDILLNLANAAYDGGDYPVALGVYLKTVRLDPGHVDARVGVAACCRQLGKSHEALVHYRKVIELAPEDTGHLINLGNLCLETGRHAEALQVFRQAERLEPDAVAIKLNIGLALEYAGRMDEALVHYEHADAAASSADIGIASATASVYERLGRFQEAWEAIKPHIGSEQVTARSAAVFSHICNKTGNCELALQLLRRLAESAELDDENRRLVFFSLGRLLDRRTEYDAAFDAYASGNALKKFRYSAAKDAEFTTALIQVFTDTRLESTDAPVHRSEAPIFIVGMPRSGTSLVEQILACHPRVYGAGELLLLGRLVGQLPEFTPHGREFPHCVPDLTPEILRRLSEQYLGELQAIAPGADRITDKMPHNFVYLGLICAMFPRAKIIHCTRDAVDTCLSCYFQDFIGYHNYAYKLENIADHYLQYRRIMQFWEDTLQVPMLEINYERLVEDSPGVISALLDYCGLEWHEACLRFHESGRNIRTASYDQVRQPLYRGSIGRWRHYEKHLAPLLDRLGTYRT